MRVARPLGPAEPAVVPRDRPGRPRPGTAVAAQERPKYTRYEDHTFITAYASSLADDDADIALHRISMFVVGNALITVRESDAFDMRPVLDRWHENADLLHHGVAALVHGVLDVVVDTHFDTVQALDDSIERLEDDYGR